LDELVYATAAGAAAIAIVAVTAVALKKRHPEKYKFNQRISLYIRGL
jgi:hypothetical protein